VLAYKCLPQTFALARIKLEEFSLNSMHLKSTPLELPRDVKKRNLVVEVLILWIARLSVSIQAHIYKHVGIAVCIFPSRHATVKVQMIAVVR